MHAFIQQMFIENLLGAKCQATDVVLVLMGETARVSGTGQVESTDSRACHQWHGVTTRVRVTLKNARTIVWRVASDLEAGEWGRLEDLGALGSFQKENLLDESWAPCLKEFGNCVPMPSKG